MTESLDCARTDSMVINSMLARAARWERICVAGWRTRGETRVIVNLATVLSVVGAAVTLTTLVGGARPDVTSSPALLLAGLTVSAGSTAALMLFLAGRLAGSPRSTWAGLIVGWYSLLAIPISTVRGLGGDRAPLPAAAGVLGHAVTVLLWVLVVAAPVLPTVPHLLGALVGTVAPLVAGAALWAAAAPDSVVAVADSPVWWMACAIGWVVVGLVVLARASLGDVPGLGLVGAGFAMVGAAQAGRLAVLAPAGAETAPPFAALQLVAVAVVLCGGLRVLRRALLRLRVEQTVRVKELRRAQRHLARAAERDHDLRNGLAGLAGATAVLGGGVDSEALSRVVASELRRLDGMLAQPVARDPDGGEEVYAVAPALDGLVMLRRSAGMDVRADVEPSLRATGSASTLAQVVTNLLANAERHAPGSPVRIAARRRGARVEIRVRDFGPGVPPGQECAVFEAGARDEQTGGLGLGLHVCRTLLAAEDATIEILPAEPHSPGCVVVIGLPAGGWTGPERPGRFAERERDTSSVGP